MLSKDKVKELTDVELSDDEAESVAMQAQELVEVIYSLNQD